MRELSAAAAVASRPGWQTEDSICGDAELAGAAARRWRRRRASKLSRPPMGAEQTGRRSFLPRNVR